MLYLTLNYHCLLEKIAANKTLPKYDFKSDYITLVSEDGETDKKLNTIHVMKVTQINFKIRQLDV